MVTSRPWWRLLVGGKMGGALQIVRDVVFWGLGEIPAVGTDVVTLASVTLPS